MNVDNEIFGVLTVLPLLRGPDAPAHLRGVVDLVTRLVAGTKNEQAVVQLAELLGNKEHRVGLLLFERFINLPPQLAVPSYDTLFNEVRKAKARKVPGFDLTHYLLLSKAMVPQDAAAAGDGIIYHNPEEEVMAEKAFMALDIDGARSKDSDAAAALVAGVIDGAAYLRRTRVLGFKADKTDELKEAIKNAFPF